MIILQKGDEFFFPLGSCNNWAAVRFYGDDACMNIQLDMYSQINKHVILGNMILQPKMLQLHDEYCCS